jgi:hypothetical protein
MQLFLERLLYFWGVITLIGLLLAALIWAITIVIYVAFISLFIAIVATAFYHFYWANRDN